MKPKTLAERFWPKVDKNGPVPAHRPELGPCHLWTAWLNNKGYGQISVGGSAGGLRLAHRVSWEMANGPIPEGLDLDHLCRTPACVNPAHLEPVTRRENVRRGIDVGKAGALFQRAKTHCPAGHAYAGENLYINPKGKRNCRTCRRDGMRRYKRRGVA